MTKLCPRGKAAAKRKFKVYPSAYANAYASRICAGKIKDPSGVKRKDFRGPKKAMGGRIGYKDGTEDKRKPFETLDKKRQMTDEPIIKFQRIGSFTPKSQRGPRSKEPKDVKPIQPSPKPDNPRRKKIGRPTPNTTPKRGKATDLLNKKPKMEMPMMSGGRVTRAGGGLMEATARLKRQGLKGGGICKRGMNRDAVGKNS